MIELSRGGNRLRHNRSRLAGGRRSGRRRSRGSRRLGRTGDLETRQTGGCENPEHDGRPPTDETTPRKVKTPNQPKTPARGHRRPAFGIPRMSETHRNHHRRSRHGASSLLPGINKDFRLLRHRRAWPTDASRGWRHWVASTKPGLGLLATAWVGGTNVQSTDPTHKSRWGLYL